MNDRDDNPKVDDDENNMRHASIGQSLGTRETDDNTQSSLSVQRDPQMPDGHVDDGKTSEVSIPLELQNRKSEASSIDVGKGKLSSLPPRPDGAIPATAGKKGSPPINHEIRDVRGDKQVEDASTQDKLKKDRSKLRKGKWTVCKKLLANCICSRRAHLSHIHFS